MDGVFELAMDALEEDGYSDALLCVLEHIHLFKDEA